MVPSEETLWDLVRTRTASNAFLYGVLSTKIYCRPSCPARLARRANIVYFSRSAVAEKAGFRACKRCKPSLALSSAAPSPTSHDSLISSDSTLFPSHEQLVEPALLLTCDQTFGRICNLIEDAVKQGRERELTLAVLAKEAGVSVWHFQRRFTKVVGISPRAFAKMCRERGSADEVASEKVEEHTVMDSNVMSFVELGFETMANGDEYWPGVLRYDEFDVDGNGSCR